ncbi:MAG: hypothetical protein ACLTC3_08310 [Evtepia gabavorous]
MNESLYPFVNHTTYDIKALSALNRLAEASVRKEKSRRTKSLCWLLGVVGLVGGAYCYPHQNLVGSLLLLYGVILLLVAISWKNFQLRSSQRQLPGGCGSAPMNLMRRKSSATPRPASPGTPMSRLSPWYPTRTGTSSFST